jgi:hypothetical protein
MSGGSYDYAYSKVQYMAESIQGRETDPLRAAFAQHLRLVAKAMRDVEWVDSCDYGKGDEHEAIRAVLDKGAELVAAVEIARAARVALDEAIARASVPA